MEVLKGSSDMEDFDVEELKKLVEYLSLIRPVAEKAYKLHHQGLERSELLELIDRVEAVVRHSGEGRELNLLKRLRGFIEILPEWAFPLQPSRFVRSVAEVLKSLPSIPRPRLLPSPQDIGDLLEDFNTLISVLVDDLNRYTRLLVQFFKVSRPEVLPYLIRLAKGNPGYIKGPLGEALCIWWLSRALGTRKDVWRGAFGPLRVYGREVDALSLRCRDSMCSYTVAEVKISGDVDRLREAVDQLAERVELLSRPEVLRAVAKEAYRAARLEKAVCEEAAVVTLYEVEDGVKKELRELLKKELRRRGAECASAEVYDGRAIVAEIKGFEGSEKYRELFETVKDMLKAM